MENNVNGDDSRINDQIIMSMVITYNLQHSFSYAVEEGKERMM